MSKTIVSTSLAPKAVGPYSQGVRVGNLVYTAGQAALDPNTQQLISGGITEQTHRTLQNLKAVLEAAGTSLDRVVKANAYLKDMNDFAAMNEVYGKFFSTNKPARATVQAARLPRDARVEIECIAAV